MTLQDSLIDLADEEAPVGKDGRTDTGWVHRQKLRINARQWLLAKMWPKVFGDRVDVASGGGLTLTVVTGVVRGGDEQPAVLTSVDTNGTEGERAAPRRITATAPVEAEAPTDTDGERERGESAAHGEPATPCPPTAAARSNTPPRPIFCSGDKRIGNLQPSDDAVDVRPDDVRLRDLL